MVHKKFIKKGDKVFGPYYYENKREDGKVVTRYVGRDSVKKDSRKISLWVILFFVLLFVFAFAISDKLRPTGRISFDVLGGIYEPGEKIGGKLEFYLSGGELVPEDSLIIIEVDGMTKEILFSSVVSGELAEGEFYAEDADLDGSGKGYGVLGKKEVYPDVEFDILVYSDEPEGAESEVPAVDSAEPAPFEESSPEPEVRGSSGGSGGSGGDAVETPVEPEPPVETPEEPISPGVEAPEGPGVGAGIGEGAGITGLAVTSEGTVISGVAAKESDFTYSLGNNEKARLVSGSVKVGGEKVSDDIVSFSSRNGEAVVSTDYYEEEEGFGEDYFDKKISKTISIDLHDLNLFAEESVSSIDVALVHSGKILAHASKEIIVKEKIIGANESMPNATENATYEVQTVQHRAVLGQPVKWSKRVSFNENPADKVVVEFSDDVDDVKVAEVIKRKKAFPEQGASIVINVSDDGEEIRIEEDNREEDFAEDEVSNDISITGEVTADLKLSKQSNVLENFVVFLRGLFGPTGRVVSEVSTSSPDEVVEEVTIEYFTDAPYAVEEERGDEKEVKIVGPENIHYQEVLAFSDIPEKFEATSPGTVKIFWQENEAYILPEVVLDKDGNGVYDYVEWIVPQLSNQTFIIEIVKAEHLDSGRQFVSDIFNEVSVLDGNWSEAINDGEYARITFEKNLTSENDITIYPRIVNGTPSVEIYEVNGSDLIAIFDSLAENQYNKVYLLGLEGSQEVFDLKVIGGSVEFDHIIDPTDLPPDVSFISPTPDNGETVTASSFVVNVSSTDALTSHYAFTDFDSDLVLWIRMDDLVPETTNPDDLSSYNNDGSSVGNAVQALGGKYGKKFVFDGSGDYISLGTNPSISSFNKSIPFTVSAWVNFNDTSAIRHIVSDASAAGVGWAVLYDTGTSKLAFQISDGTVTATCVMAGTVADNNWHFFFGRYDGTNVECGLDGSESGDVTSYNGGGFLNAVGVSIGSLHSSSALRAWNGSIDEVLIFNRSLHNDELDSINNATSKQYSHNFTGLGTQNYSFTAYAVDTSGNKNNTETRTVTISGGGAGGPDAAPPNVNITFPANTTYYSSDLPFNFEVVLNENGGTVLYSLNGGTNNVTMSTENSRTYTSINSSIASGSYTFSVYANDTAGNRNYTESVTFSFNDSLINGCGNLTTAGGTYQLTGNIIPPASLAGPCINIKAENITFDGKGFTIGNSTFSYDVIYSNQKYTTVRNVNLTRATGLSSNGEIYFAGANHSNVTGVTFSNGNTGIVLSSTYHSYFDGNTFATSDRGVHFIATSGNNTFNLNSFEGGNYGAAITGDGNTIKNTNLSSAAINAIYLSGSHNSFYNVRITDSVQTAVYLFSGDNNTLNNTIIAGTNPSYYDIDFVSSNGTNLIDSIIGKYTLNAAGSTLRVVDSEYGEVRFLNPVNGTGDNFTRDISFTDNLINVRSDLNLGLNRSANVSLVKFALPGSPGLYIFRNGLICGDCWNFTSEDADPVIFNVTGFTNYSVGALPSCTTGLDSCTEGGSCVIDRDCRLNSDSCTGGICQFSNLTFNGDIYTDHDSNGNALDLDINLSGQILFSSGKGVIFSGEDGTTGGNASVVNITMPPTGLFNRTNAVFTGTGGDSSVSNFGGDGGILQISYHGLLGATWSVDVSAGTGPGGLGLAGSTIQNKYLAPCPVDADVNDDGEIRFADINLIRARYNNLSTDSGFSAYNDINCDGEINVIELSRIGFEFERGFIL